MRQLSKTLVRQQDQTDCGVACLLSLIQYYGGAERLERLRELSGTNRQGTTLLGLYQAAKALGFTAQGCEADIKALIEHAKPVILHVLIEQRLQHYVVCYGLEKKNGKDYFVIGDPARGFVSYTVEELDTIWQSHTCLTLEPNEHFVTAKEFRGSKKTWLWSVLKEDMRLLVISLVLGIVIAALGMAMAVFSQKLIDNILPSQNLTKLVMGVALLGLLLLARVGLSSLREYVLARQTKDFNNRIIDHFYGALLRLPKSFFDTRKIGELVARLNDTGRIQKVILHVVGNVLIEALVVLVSLGFLFYYDYRIALLVLLSGPIYFFIIYRFNQYIIRGQREVMQRYAFTESNYISSTQGIADIKNFNREGIFQSLNRLVYGALQESLYSLGLINVRLGLWSGMAAVLFLIALLGYGSYQVLTGNMSLGEFMAILGIAGSLLPSIANLALVAIPLNEAKVAFERTYEFASFQTDTDGERQLDYFQSLQAKEITFRFPGQKQLLKDINLKVVKGELIAIVGESGCGKSTLGQLLQRFYTPESGSILINGEIPLKDLELESWRRCIGVIPQDIHIFNGTVLDNVLMGSEESPERVVGFCRQFGFERFIEALPQSYITLLGEEGINLSGGQKQIIALLRVLFHNPQLLLMDEATSAMDRNTERFTLDLIHSLKKEMGVIFISHRLNNLPKIADRIYIIEDGKTIAEGTHEELLSHSNFYSAYWKELEGSLPSNT